MSVESGRYVAEVVWLQLYLPITANIAPCLVSGEERIKTALFGGTRREPGQKSQLRRTPEKMYNITGARAA